MMLGKDTDESLTARVARTITAERSRTFTAAEAADVLGVAASDLRQRIIAGEVDVIQVAGAIAIPWAEVVSLGVQVWPPEVFDEALSHVGATVIPELLRFTTIDVRLPRLAVVALERLARRERRTVSAVLTSELHDLVSAHSEWLSRDVAGFAAAFAWPYDGD